MEHIFSQIHMINWWAILAATLSTLPVGFAWYNNAFGFGKIWEKSAGLTKKDLEETKKNMALLQTQWLLQSFVLAILLTCLMRALGVQGFYDSLMFGLIMGALVRGTTHIGNDGFENKPRRLTLINLSQDAVSTTVMAIILGIWL